MKYTKHEVGPYNIHVIKTDKFKTVTMRINFKRKAVKEELTHRNLLSRILVESSNKYPNQRLLAIATEDLYNQKISTSSILSGFYSVISFSTQFLNEKYTEEGMLEHSISFITDIILDPDLEDGKFRGDKLQNVKNKLVEAIKESEKSPSSYAYHQLLETMGDNAVYSWRSSGNIEDVDSVNPKSLTDYYKQVIHSDIIDIFIIGDVDKNLIKRLLSEKFLINTIKKPGDTHFYEHDKFRKRVKKLSESYDSKQSQLVIGSKISHLTDFERKYIWFLYNFILGGGTDSRLFKTVREKHSLCYNISSRIKILSNVLIITAGIDKGNSAKTQRLIRKEMLNITKGLIEDNEIEKAKVNYINSLNEITDSPLSIMNHYIEKEYFGSDDIETQIKNINNINKQMIVDFAKKVHPDTIFLLEGGE
ncbi:MAG: insulinase family protein [Bacilli bacterium]|nr:insulinase family protein [Bacilli bacterium]MDD4282686.1 insulinase family protein [Bacilli bacterium]MDD4719092.1 insulinase family protein [Bacilli bacterium]